jgi:hypothetical protein
MSAKKSFSFSSKNEPKKTRKIDQIAYQSIKSSANYPHSQLDQQKYTILLARSASLASNTMTKSAIFVFVRHTTANFPLWLRMAMKKRTLCTRKERCVSYTRTTHDHDRENLSTMREFFQLELA